MSPKLKDKKLLSGIVGIFSLMFVFVAFLLLLEMIPNLMEWAQVNLGLSQVVVQLIFFLIFAVLAGASIYFANELSPRKE